MDADTVTIVITTTGTGRKAVGVEYSLVARLPEFQSPDIEAWLADHGCAAENPYVSAHVLTGNHDWSRIPVDAPRLRVAATDALLQQLGIEDGIRSSLTAHPYDEGTYVTALADLYRLGDSLGRRDEIIRAAAACGIPRGEIDVITGLAVTAVERALASLDPEASGGVMEAGLEEC
jgi:hypothetical protein